VIYFTLIVDTSVALQDS